jgi:RNA polymerase-interacting CarD/CdnL/TRCF family regulator
MDREPTQQVSSQISTPQKSGTPNVAGSQENFGAGATLIYGAMGRYVLRGISEKTLSGERVRGYELEKYKLIPNPQKTDEPVVWVPLRAAKSGGLRLPIQNEAELQAVWDILHSDEDFAPPKKPWPSIKTQCDPLCRSQGFIGLTKAVCASYVFRFRDPAPAKVVVKYQEDLYRTLIWEMENALEVIPGSPESTDLRARVDKALRLKL